MTQSSLSTLDVGHWQRPGAACKQANQERAIDQGEGEPALALVHHFEDVIPELELGFGRFAVFALGLELEGS